MGGWESCKLRFLTQKTNVADGLESYLTMQHGHSRPDATRNLHAWIPCHSRDNPKWVAFEELPSLHFLYWGKRTILISWHLFQVYCCIVKINYVVCWWRSYPQQLFVSTDSTWTFFFGFGFTVAFSLQTKYDRLSIQIWCSWSCIAIRVHRQLQMEWTKGSGYIPVSMPADSLSCLFLPQRKHCQFLHVEPPMCIPIAPLCACRTYPCRKNDADSLCKTTQNGSVFVGKQM